MYSFCSNVVHKIHACMEYSIIFISQSGRTQGIIIQCLCLSDRYIPTFHLNFELQASPVNECLGMDYLVQAAERGMKLAMLEVAKAFDSGVGLGKAPDNDASFPAKQR